MSQPNTRLIVVSGQKPEDVAVLSTGELVTGLDDGRVVAVHPESGQTRTLVNTGGRPLGLEVTADDRVIICDTELGLLQFEPDRQVLTTLAERFAGEPLRFCNNASVARDGTIYFSQSSRRYGLEDWKRDLIDGIGTGRLFRRSPSGELTLLADRLWFTNGVTLTADESSLIYAQSGAMNLTRLWLKGDKAGQHEPFFAALEGFPDNLCTDHTGLIWVALASAKDRRFALIQRLPERSRRIIGWLQQLLPIHPKGTVWAQAYDQSGKLVHDVHFQHPEFQLVTGMRRVGDCLYLSSLEGGCLLAVNLSS